jgi:type IV secretion system protein VirB5
MHTRWRVLGACLLLGLHSAAHAQFAVIDIGAIAQLIQQLKTMSDQLQTAKSQLTEAQRTLDSMRGGRGMERLLAGTERNYLPPTWQELERAVNQASAQYQRLSAQYRAIVQSNAILSPQVLASLSVRDREELEEARRKAAMLQAASQQALSASSDRFSSLQQLIDAIPRATDQKGVLDLQARIAAEQAMLANEQTKLYVLTQAAEGEERVRKQRLREEALRAIGSFRDLPPMGLLEVSP